MTIGHNFKGGEFMRKFGEFVCKYRKIILLIALLLLIPSIIGIKATRINYDILVYLPENIETIQLSRQANFITLIFIFKIISLYRKPKWVLYWLVCVST